MDIVIEFQGRKSPGVECNRVQVAIRSHNGKDSSECIVRGISLDCNLSVRDPMGKDQSCGESLFKCFKSGMALIGEMPWGTLVGKMHERDCDFRISIDETMVEVGKAKERLDILDFLWYWPILDDLDFVWGHGEAFGGQHISKVFTGSDMELAFVCTGKKSVSAESAEYFPNVEFVLRNIVRIDEDVIQIYDDYDINHIRENVVHKSLKSGGCISKPFRHYQPLKGTVTGSECSLPFVSR